jgi:hypothetical protein
MKKHNKIITLKISDDEFIRFKEKAIANGLTVSGYIRQLIENDGCNPSQVGKLEVLEKRIMWLLVHIFSMNRTSIENALPNESLDTITEYADSLMTKWGYK